MTQQAQPTNVLPASILLVAIASGSLLLMEEPFKSGRHSETAKTTTPVTPSAEIVDARLWQDPLPRIRSDWRRILSQIDEQELESTGDGPDDLRLTLPNDELPWSIADFRDHLAEAAGRHAESGCERLKPRLLVLPMLVPGSNYDNDIEVRRRSRYAMISALTSAQYAPTNGQKLGYFLAPRAGPFLRTGSGRDGDADIWRQPIIVGFEWFEQQRYSVNRYRCSDPLLKWDAIVALWINEADLNLNPLAQIDALLTYMTSELLQPGSEVEPIVALKVIGPSSSAVLANIYDEVERYGADSESQPVRILTNHNRRFAAAADLFTVDCAVRMALRPYDNACGFPGDPGSGDLTGGLPASTPSYQFAVYPQPGGLVFEGPEFASDMLVLSLDSYLYGGLPDGLNTNNLKECARRIVQDQFGTEPEALMTSIEVFGQAELCLSDPELNKIIDADAEWRSVVADIWLAQTKWQLLNPTLDIQLRNASERVRGEESDLVASLVEDANYYLDWGVPPKSDIGGVFECLAPVMTIDEREEWLSSAESCLVEHLPVDPEAEFDGDWAASIAEEWFTNNSHILLDNGREQERVATLLHDETMTVMDMVELLSPRSTMPLALIARSEAGTQDQTQVSKGAVAPRGQIRSDSDFLGIINKAGVPLKDFRSTIARDQLTAALLVEELWRRKVFSNDRDDIAILFELDSDYGRTLPILVECYVQQILASKEEAGRGSLFDPSTWFRRQSPITVLDLGCTFTGQRRGSANTVHSFGYFAGIDGLEMPGEEAGSQAGDSSSGADADGAAGDKGILELPADLELPVGASQFDYLRRLARVVQQTDEELHDESSSAGLRAVGIFGTDIYDKQLILQALHKSLPNTVFFTTDLDARLAHPGQYEWNRNLIVASAYGLGLSSEAFVRVINPSTRDSDPEDVTNLDFSSSVSDTATQSVEIGMPPLRGVYQTALFLTTKLALLENADEEAEFFGQPFEPPLPRLFEIGRYGEVDITPVPPALAEPDCTPGNLQERKSRLQYTAIDSCIHGMLGWTQYGSTDIRRILFNSAILMSPILLLTFVWGRHWFLVDRKAQSIEWQAYRAATIFGVASILTILACLVLWRNPAAEPWLLFDGISGIPALVLRTIALVYSIIIGITAFGRFRQNNLNLADRFGLDKDFPGAWPLRFPAAWPGLHIGKKQDYSTVAWIRQINDDSRHGNRLKKPATEIWKKYRTLGHPVARLLRCGPAAIAVCFVVLYWYLEGMHDHALMRGWIVTFDTWLTSITGVTVIFVIFLTTDAMHLSQAFIRALARYDVTWPPMKGDPTYRVMGLDEKVYFRMRCVDMIVYRTEMITPTIIMPFALIFFLLLARTDLFDNWEWNAPLVLIYVALSVFLLIRALLMQREAEQARNRIVMRLRRRKNAILEEYKGENESTGRKLIEQTDSLIDYVLNIRRGAFVPWLQHPIVQAILLPFTGFGAIAILDAVL